MKQGDPFLGLVPMGLAHSLVHCAVASVGYGLGWMMKNMLPLPKMNYLPFFCSVLMLRGYHACDYCLAQVGSWLVRRLYVANPPKRMLMVMAYVQCLGLRPVADAGTSCWLGSKM